jgi:hypothetical protein
VAGEVAHTEATDCGEGDRCDRTGSARERPRQENIAWRTASASTNSNATPSGPSSPGVYAGKSEQDLAIVEQELRLSVKMSEASLSQGPFEKWRIGTAAYDCGGLTTAAWKGKKRTVDWTLVKMERSVVPRAIVEVPKAIRGAGTGTEVSLRGLFPDGDCDYTALRFCGRVSE